MSEVKGVIIKIKLYSQPGMFLGDLQITEDHIAPLVFTWKNRTFMYRFDSGDCYDEIIPQSFEGELL